MDGGVDCSFSSLLGSNRELSSKLLASDNRGAGCPASVTTGTVIRSFNGCVLGEAISIIRSFNGAWVKEAASGLSLPGVVTVVVFVGTFCLACSTNWNGFRACSILNIRPDVGVCSRHIHWLVVVGIASNRLPSQGSRSSGAYAVGCVIP